MVFVNLEEGNAQLTALLGGDIDFATDVGPEGMAGLAGSRRPDRRCPHRFDPLSLPHVLCG